MRFVHYIKGERTHSNYLVKENENGFVEFILKKTSHSNNWEKCTNDDRKSYTNTLTVSAIVEGVGLRKVIKIYESRDEMVADFFDVLLNLEK